MLFVEYSPPSRAHVPQDPWVQRDLSPVSSGAQHSESLPHASTRTQGAVYMPLELRLFDNLFYSFFVVCMPRKIMEVGYYTNR